MPAYSLSSGILLSSLVKKAPDFNRRAPKVAFYLNIDDAVLSRLNV